MNERLDAACEYWFYGSSLRWYRKASGSLERNYRTRVWHFCLLAWWMSTINEQSRWISKAQLAAQPRDLQRSYGGAGFRWRWLPPEWSNGTVKMASKIESTENISTKCKTALLVSKLLKNAGISCTLFRWQTISFKIATTKPAFLLIGFSYIFLHQNLHIADYNIEAIFCQITQIYPSSLCRALRSRYRYWRPLVRLELNGKEPCVSWRLEPLAKDEPTSRCGGRICRILVNRFATQLSRCVREPCSWACGNCA